MKKKTLSKSQIKDLNMEISSLYGIEPFNKKDAVQIVEEGLRLIQSMGRTLFFYHENRPIPSLKYLMENNFLKKVTVDMGAVKFVSGGADIMRPGITLIDDSICENELVSVIDQNNKVPLAVGISIYPSIIIRSMSSGKVVKTIHHVGDKVWYA